MQYRRLDILAKIVDIIERTPYVKSFRLAIDGKIEFLAGQWGLVKVRTASGLKKPLNRL